MNLNLDPTAIQRLLKAGGPDLVRQMVCLFLENMPRRLAGAAAAAKAGNWPEVERAFHSMKSSAGYLGLEGLADYAARIELYASQGLERDLAPLLQELSASLPAIQTVARKLAQVP